MTSTRRALLVATVPWVLALVLGGCAGAAGGVGSPTATAPAQPSDIAPWTEWVGIAPDLVFVTEIEGFDLATQSVGVVGDDGMSAMYVRSGGDVGTVLLTTGRGADPSVTACAELPDDVEPTLRCAVERGVAYVLLEGEGVAPADLRTAGQAVRVPRADELADLFADLPVPQAPVERPDLQQGGEGKQLEPEPRGG